MNGKGSKNRTRDFKKYWESSFWDNLKKPAPDKALEEDLIKLSSGKKDDNKRK